MKIIRKGLFLIAGLGIASCSMLGTGSSSSSAEDGVSASGIGRDGTIISRFNPRSYALVAPHNQTYHFAFDSSSVAKVDVPSLQAQADYLKTHPVARVLLAGHTDLRGSREYNVALGERRANSVKRFLQQQGVSRRQLRIVSYGKEKPVAFTQNDAAHRLNRRTELRYEDKG